MTTQYQTLPPEVNPSGVEIAASSDCKAGDITSEVALEPWIYAALQLCLKRNPRASISGIINAALEQYLEPESPFSDIEGFHSDREVA